MKHTYNNDEKERIAQIVFDWLQSGSFATKYDVNKAIEDNNCDTDNLIQNLVEVKNVINNKLSYSELENLSKELYHRIPYGVKCVTSDGGYLGELTNIDLNTKVCTFKGGATMELNNVRVCLYPINKMSHELIELLRVAYIEEDDLDKVIYDIKNHYGFKCLTSISYCTDIAELMYRKHIDINSLIEDGLGFDAEILNIY